jgi:hypothetical protein
VQQGNTSQPVANKLVAEHRAAQVRVYAYDAIETHWPRWSSNGSAPAPPRLHDIEMHASARGSDRAQMS